MRTRNAAVIGASGFIGGALAVSLEASGTPVARYTRTSPFHDETGRLADGIVAADTVFWLASSIRPATAQTDEGSAAADQQALTRLLDGLAAARGVESPRIVVVSSGGTVYDPHSPSPHTEANPTKPTNQYGEAMLEIESLVTERITDSVVLRVSNAYGPGQPVRRGQGVIAYWLNAIAAGEPIHVLGDDSVARDYVFIDDVVAALLAVHHAGAVPPVLNIGSGIPTTLASLVDLVCQVVAPREVAVSHEAGRSFDAPSTWLDVSLAATTLGWQPRVELAAGLARTWEGLR